MESNIKIIIIVEREKRYLEEKDAPENDGIIGKLNQTFLFDSFYC